MRFSVVKKDGNARAGLLELSRGVVHTPAFMPVGTIGTVKAMSTDELKEIGTEIVLSNTYHLYLRPGHEVVSSLGGLHAFSDLWGQKQWFSEMTEVLRKQWKPELSWDELSFKFWRMNGTQYCIDCSARSTFGLFL